MNYKEYAFSMGEFMQVLVKTLGVTILIAVLFYRSPWAMMLSPFLFALMYKREKMEKKEKRLREIQEEFMNGMRTLSSSIQAGLSIENAWKEMQGELGIMYGETSLFYREVKEMNYQIGLNIPIEKLLLEFAYRTELEDIISFAEVLDYAKRTGGNWRKIIEVTVYRMCEKQDAQKEIQVMIAAKKMEQQVMNVIPLGILVFLQLSSWDYMRVLYHNPLGIICMTVCLIGYAGALFLSEIILRIRV